MPDMAVRREASGVRRGGPRDSGLRLTPHALRLTSFVPQRLHRRQGARLGGGDPAGDDTGERRDSDPDQDEGETDLRGKDLVDGERDPRAESHADDAAERGEQRRLEQELPADIPPPGAESAPNADLLGP